jgi:hypothetical protein
MAKREYKKVKMKVVYERGTTWITTKGRQWMYNKYPDECVDKFFDVWLRPTILDGVDERVYVTAEGPELYFVIEDGYLKEI